MSISGALHNALSGLQAAGRASEVVANNVSNALTPGYGPRSIELASQRLGDAGGVFVEGVVRNVDTFLLSDRRLASADRGFETARTGFLERIENLLGTPDQVGSLTAQLSNFENALVTAASRPDASERLSTAVTAARDLASSLNRASDNIQAARSDADRTIDQQVRQLNEALENVQTLNGKIVAASIRGSDIGALKDQRQNIIDSISEMVPVRLDDRANGAVALYTPGGAIILDGSPAEIGFNPNGVVTAYNSIQNNTLSGLTLNGQAIDVSSNGSPLMGGTLIAQFSIRDELGVEAQSQLDAVARDLVERFADPNVDPTLAVGDPGLFTDEGAAFDPLDEVGLSSRLQINALVDPQQGGETWRLRDGLGAAVPGEAGDATILQSLNSVLSELRAPASGDFGTGSYSATGLMSSYLSQIAADRLQADQRLSFAVAQHDELVQLELANGVDSDAELQRLLLIEQTYAANARIVEAVEEMLDALTRI